jgi:hypothetical protein
MIFDFDTRFITSSSNVLIRRFTNSRSIRARMFYNFDTVAAGT